MLSQKKIQLIQSLQRKKYRQKYNMFVVEGNKSIKEIVDSNYEIEEIYSTEPIDYYSYTPISENELKKISSLKNPSGALAVVKIPPISAPLLNVNTLVLDNIQDPGNLGTMIRTADWFGISQIVASPHTVEVYNPKVIQATMGSFSRISVFYEDLSHFLDHFEGNTYLADMNGENLYSEKIRFPFALVMGNEGNGISPVLKSHGKVISIPKNNPNSITESLNVSIATAIILSNFTQKT